MRTEGRTARAATGKLVRRGLSACAVGVALAALGGCPGTLENKYLYEDALEDAGNVSTDAGPCGNVITRIFVPSCGDTGCHGAVAPQQGLDLVSPGVASRVVGVTGKGCPVTLADPSAPEQSLIYTKLSPTPSCGSPMPLARAPLTDDDIACVLAWIAAQ